MKIPVRRTMAALGTAFMISLAGCSTAEVRSIASQAQSQGGAVISNLTEQAKGLGEKSLEVARNLKDSIAGYIQNLNGSAPVTAQNFEAAWNDVKLKLDQMAEDAVSPETKSRIKALSQSLQDQYRDAYEKISSNENVEQAKEAASQFWTEVKTKMDELAP